MGRSFRHAVIKISEFVLKIVLSVVIGIKAKIVAADERYWLQTYILPQPRKL